MSCVLQCIVVLSVPSDRGAKISPLAGRFRNRRGEYSGPISSLQRVIRTLFASTSEQIRICRDLRARTFFHPQTRVLCTHCPPRKTCAHARVRNALQMDCLEYFTQIKQRDARSAPRCSERRDVTQARIKRAEIHRFIDPQRRRVARVDSAGDFLNAGRSELTHRVAEHEFSESESTRARR